MGQPYRYAISLYKRTEFGEQLNKHIREQIAEAREEKGFSQRELSEKIGRSSAFVSQVESGRLDLTVLDLASLALFLDKPIDYFLPKVIKHEEEGLTDKEWRIVRQFRRIPSEEIQDVAISQVKQLAGMKPKAKKQG